MRQVAAGRAHRLRQDDVRRQVGLAAPQIRQRAAGVRRVDAAGEEPARSAASGGPCHARPPPCDSNCARARTCRRPAACRGKISVIWKSALGRDRLERPANLRRRIGLGIEGVHLARRAEVEDHDHRAVVVLLLLLLSRPLLRRQKLRQRQTHRAAAPTCRKSRRVTPSQV